MRVVIAIPAAGLLAGCACGLAWPGLGVPSARFLLVLSALAAFGALGARHSAGVAGGVLLGFFLGGLLLSGAAWEAAWRSTLRVAFESIARDQRSEALREGRVLPVDDEALAVVVGMLQADAAPTANGGVSLRVAVHWVGRARSGAAIPDPAVNPVEGGAVLTVAGVLAAERMDEWRAGRTIRAPVQLHRPARYLDPGVADQERALARRGVSLVGAVKSGALVEVVARGSPVAEAAGAVRAFARRAIRVGVGRWSLRSAGIVAAIVIGDRSGLDDEVERRLQEAGTYHVIAISGGNIAILAGLTLTAFRVAGFLGPGAMLSAIAGLLAYGYLVGGGASVDRATCMATVYFLGRALDLRGSPLNALALVAGTLVVSDPLAIADPAFLLTFGATAAILVFAPATSGRGWPRLAAPLVGMFVASVAAEAALLPVAARIFSRVTFAGLVLNFAAIPLMAVAQIAGMLVVPLFLVAEPLARAAGWVAHAGAAGLVRSAELVRVAPAVTWRVAPPAAAAIAAYYAGGIAAAWLWRRRASLASAAESLPARVGRTVATGTSLCAAVWILAEPWSIIRIRGDGRLHVTFIDVGQGDAAIVTFPRGATMLVDAGGLVGSPSFDVGDRVVAPVLRHGGVRRLSTIILSHGDADHVAGAAAALREFRPADVWEGIPVPRSATLQTIHHAAQTAGSHWRNVQAGDLLTVDGASVVVRHPALPDWERQDVRNEDSIVLEVLWREVSIVLTGDIGVPTERAIAPSFSRVPLRVVKVPHHGSRTSSSEVLLRALMPNAAIVSVGRGNRFGHPSPEVMRRYGAIGAEVFRTDLDGAVTVDTDGTSIDLSSMTGRRAHLVPRVP